MICNDLPRIPTPVKNKKGDDISMLIDEIDDIVKSSLSIIASGQQRNLANNCKLSLVAYGMMETSGGVHVTNYGKLLLEIKELRRVEGVNSHGRI